jgi:acetyl esterase/lipase
MADNPQPLLTEKSLALALAPPRAPPFGTLHHTLLLAQGDPSTQPIAHHVHPSTSTIRRDQARARLQERLFLLSTPRRNRLPHPHLTSGPVVGDQMTRFLGTLLPLKWHNACRDSGAFRWICDTLVPASAPLMLTSTMVTDFRKLSARVQRHQYGPHPRHILELYPPTTTTEPTTTVSSSSLLVFIHGGAWGSGLPWLYRLVANAFPSHTVAVVGYRTYPCAQTVDDQVADCQVALDFLIADGPPDQHITLMGHSSGAHVALMLVVEQAKQKRSRVNIQSFVGLSGPYDISHHFDFEAARGVEELSPMKAICGYTRQAFRYNSPALRLQAALVDASDIVNYLPSRMLLVHGMEDSTVPFTATAEAASVLRLCGVTVCQELYIAQIGHQDTVMHMMVGGSTRDAVLEWMNNDSNQSQPRVQIKVPSKL